MDITAVRENPNKPYTLTLNGAPSGSVVEVRMTNTMNGSSVVHTAEVKDGKITIPLPMDFGQHVAFEARVLTAERADKVIPFHYAEDSTLDNLKLTATVEEGTPLPTNPTLQPANVGEYDAAHDKGVFDV
jgi:hypothetical protein